MKKFYIPLRLFLILSMSSLLFSATTISLSGTVKKTGGSAGLAGVKVSLEKQSSLSATTDAQGAFTISGQVAAQWQTPERSRYHYTLAGNTLVISGALQRQRGIVELYSSDGRKNAVIHFKCNGSGTYCVTLPQTVAELTLVRIIANDETVTRTILRLGDALYLKNGSPQVTGNFSLSKQSSTAVDYLIASKTGYTDARVPIDSYDKQAIAISLDTATGAMPFVYDVENTDADCKDPTTFPDFSALPNVTNFPDPFLMKDGNRITKKSEWPCRRAEISAEIQYWETGTKPPPPAASDVTATYSGGTLKVVVKVGSKSITLSSSITTPSGTGPFPVLIKMDGAGVPVSGCASMGFTSSALASTFPSRTDTFWQLFPGDPTAGSFIGWAWGVSRLIDGLYLTKDQNKIDVKHIAVSGCSYCGKMALYTGAFDERIALTIPQEAGGGGEDSWRYMSTMPTASKPGATTNDRLEDIQAAQGTGWYSTRLKQFTNANISKLPIDQHLLIAMIAPRAVLVCMNADVDRGGAEAGNASMLAASEVYKALGVPDRIGWTIPNAGGHCSWASSATADVASFVDRFMFGKTGTNVQKSPYKPDMTKWITWSTPTLQ